jgi:hypothetical protein
LFRSSAFENKKNLQGKGGDETLEAKNCNAEGEQKLGNTGYEENHGINSEVRIALILKIHNKPNLVKQILENSA